MNIKTDKCSQNKRRADSKKQPGKKKCNYELEKIKNYNDIIETLKIDELKIKDDEKELSTTTADIITGFAKNFSNTSLNILPLARNIEKMRPLNPENRKNIFKFFLFFSLLLEKDEKNEEKTEDILTPDRKKEKKNEEKEKRGDILAPNAKKEESKQSFLVQVHFSFFQIFVSLFARKYFQFEEVKTFLKFLLYSSLDNKEMGINFALLLFQCLFENKEISLKQIEEILKYFIEIFEDFLNTNKDKNKDKNEDEKSKILRRQKEGKINLMILTQVFNRLQTDEEFERFENILVEFYSRLFAYNYSNRGLQTYFVSWLRDCLAELESNDLFLLNKNLHFSRFPLLLMTKIIGKEKKDSFQFSSSTNINDKFPNGDKKTFMVFFSFIIEDKSKLLEEEEVFTIEIYNSEFEVLIKKESDKYKLFIRKLKGLDFDTEIQVTENKPLLLGITFNFDDNKIIVNSPVEIDGKIVSCEKKIDTFELKTKSNNPKKEEKNITLKENMEKKILVGSIIITNEVNDEILKKIFSLKGRYKEMKEIEQIAFPKMKYDSEYIVKIKTELIYHAANKEFSIYYSKAKENLDNIQNGTMSEFLKLNGIDFILCELEYFIQILSRFSLPEKKEDKNMKDLLLKM